MKLLKVKPKLTQLDELKNLFDKIGLKYVIEPYNNSTSKAALTLILKNNDKTFCMDQGDVWFDFDIHGNFMLIGY